ncbi:MAG: hypothetical protein IJ242_17575, partial [Clostridia bacterium]|nr:hypothetical protein [Clostridia bacterium]
MKKFIIAFLVLCMACTCAMADAGVHTYNMAAAEFPTNWSPFQNQTQTDSDLMQWLQSGLYVFDFNEDYDGYVVVPLAV